MMHAPIIARQCQLTKYTYPPHAVPCWEKTRTQITWTNHPQTRRHHNSRHSTHTHTHCDKHVINTAAQPHVPTRAQPPHNFINNNTNHPGPASCVTRSNPIHAITCPRLSSHMNNTKHHYYFLNRKPQHAPMTKTAKTKPALATTTTHKNRVFVTLRYT